MKAQTKKNLDVLAERLVQNFGGEIVEIDNFISIAKKESDSMGLGTHYNTIKDHGKYLENRVRFLAESVEKEKVEEQPHIVKIKIMMSDGSYQYFIPEVKQEVKQEIKKEVKKETEPQIWTGLFDYKPDGRIIFRRIRRYKGLDITNQSEVLTHFFNWSRVIVFIDYLLNPDYISKLHYSPDTKKDIQTLNSWKEWIIRNKNIN